MSKNSTNMQTILLEDVLDLTVSAQLVDSLHAHRGSSLRLDASRVVQLGALCLQILLSATRTWASDGVDLKIINSSPVFLDGLEGFGMTAVENVNMEADQCHSISLL